LSDTFIWHRGPEGYALAGAAAIFTVAVITAAKPLRSARTVPDGQSPRRRLPSLPGTIFLEGRGALTKTGCLLRRPLRAHTPPGLSANYPN